MFWYMHFITNWFKLSPLSVATMWNSHEVAKIHGFPSNCLIICWLKENCYLSVCVENKMFLQNWAKRSSHLGLVIFIHQNSACFTDEGSNYLTNKWTFIGACAQINIYDNVLVCVSAFVMKTSYFIEQFYLVGGVTQ